MAETKLFDRTTQSKSSPLKMNDHKRSSGINDHDISDILCDGLCKNCPQKDWCLLTPVFRYVK